MNLILDFNQIYGSYYISNNKWHADQFLHFDNEDDPLDHDEPDERLWKVRKISDTPNNKFCELYNPTERLAVDEVIVLYRGRVVFRQYIPKKHKRFGIKIYKLCDSLGYTYERVFRQATAACHSSKNSNARKCAASYLKS